MPPDNTVGSIDLRGTSGGYGFFATDQPIVGLDTYSFGIDLQSTMTTPQITIWENVIGIEITGGPYTLLDLLWNTLTIWSDETGSDRAKPLTPTHKGNIELHLGGHSLIRNRRYQGKNDPMFSKYQKLIGESYREIRQEALKGNSKDKELHLKYLEAMKRKYRANEEDLITSDLPREKGKKPTTTYTDDFSGTLSAWTVIDGGWSIVGGEIESTGNGTDQPSSIRYESDLSSDDHYSQIDFVSYNSPSNWMGCAVRMATSGETFYYNLTRATGPLNRIYKCVSDAVTSLASNTTWPGTPFTVQLQSDGSTITLYHDGISALSITDTSITGYLRGGLVSHASLLASGDEVYGDNFETGDNISSVSIAVFQNYYRQMVEA